MGGVLFMGGFHILFCPNVGKSFRREGKKRKNVANCFGLFQRKMHKKGLPGVWEAKSKRQGNDYSLLVEVMPLL